MRTMTFGGITVGDGQSICFTHGEDITGIDDLPMPRSGNVVRSRGDGSVLGPMFFGDRVVTVPLTLLDDASLPVEIGRLTAATSGRSESELSWDFGRGSFKVFARCERRSLPSNFLSGRPGVARALLQFVASDPRIYGADGGSQHSGSTGPGTRVGGLGFPTGFPLGFGTVTSSSFPTTNNGTVPAPWTGTLSGPLESPVIELMSTGERLSWDGLTIAAGQVLVLSSRERSALLGGTASRYPGPRRDWFEIPPGSDNVRLSATSGDGMLTMSWADTFL